MRILLVEDHDDSRNLLTRLLTKAGYVVDTAITLAEAKHSCRRGYDLLISDIGLPDGEGWELGAIARECEMKSIALTGDLDAEASQAAGFTEHFTKPFSFPKLLEAVERCMPPRATV